MKYLMNMILIVVIVSGVVFGCRYIIRDIVRMNREVDPHTFQIISGLDVKHMQKTEDGKPLPIVFMIGADWTTEGKLYSCIVDQDTYDWAEHLAGMKMEIPIYKCLQILPKNG